MFRSVLPGRESCSDGAESCPDTTKQVLPGLCNNITVICLTIQAKKNIEQYCTVTCLVSKNSKNPVFMFAQKGEKNVEILNTVSRENYTMLTFRRQVNLVTFRRQVNLVTFSRQVNLVSFRREVNIVSSRKQVIILQFHLEGRPGFIKV